MDLVKIYEWTKARVEGIVKVVALCAALAGSTTDTFQNGVRAVVGTDAIIEVQKDTTVRLDKLDKDVRVLKGDFEVAIFDDNQSWIKGDCYIGELCTAQHAVRRTPFGLTCDLPDPSPKVRNHGGRKLAAEGKTGAVRVGADEWNLLEFSFIAPAAALPGRGTHWIELEYQCPTGTVRTRTSMIPFKLLPRRTREEIDKATNKGTP